MIHTSRNYRVEIREYIVTSSAIPVDSDGYRICFMSDLHIGSITDIDIEINQRLAENVYDTLVLGGDYFERHLTRDERSRFLDALVRASNSSDIYAVFGNHDEDYLPTLFSKSGITCIEGKRTELPSRIGKLERSGLYITGTAFTRHGLNWLEESTCSDSPDYNIVVTHSPEFAFAAEASGYNLFLCGHTHGGQVCLPGGHIVYHGTSAPRRLCSGNWKIAEMHGLTSSGVGTSVLPIRMFCPAEVAFVTLHRDEASASNA